MNILIAATNLKHGNGGVCTHIFDLCKEYVNLGNTVVLLADGTDYIEKINAIAGLTFVELPFSRVQRSLSAFAKCYRKMRRLCDEYKIQVIHLHGQCIIPIAWLIKLTSRIPFLWTNHIDEIPKRKLLAFLQRFMRFHIISVSSELRQQLIDELNINSKDITVINNGVDLADYTPLTEKEYNSVVQKFGVKKDCYSICEVARLSFGKGQDLLIKAVYELSKKYSGQKIQVLFAGTGDKEWFEQNVLSFAHAHQIDCMYLGFQSPREVFGISDLAVLPSLFEGFSLACVEALAMKCPVVRSNTPGHSDMDDVVIVHEKGLLADLTEKLDYAFTHREEMREFAEQGRKMCEEKFNVQKMAQQTIDVYKAVLKA